MNIVVSLSCTCFVVVQIILSFSSSVFAQNGRCATESRHLANQSRNQFRFDAVEKFREALNSPQKPQYRITDLNSLGGAIISIPVVIHIIYNDLSPSPDPKRSTNISNEQVYTQLRVLNEDYRRKVGSNGFNSSEIGADIGIEFCLATTDPFGNPTVGINRVYNPKQEWDVFEDDAELKSLAYWPSDQYLNIYVANIDVKQALGYATYPDESKLTGLDGLPGVPGSAEDDGIVISYRAFGTMGTATSPFHLGRTTTHEVGHWLGLKHIWGDDVCGTDYVSDTPEDEKPNESNTCEDFSSCTGSQTADMTNNYLDYSPDRCMNIFTIGQKARMLKALMNSPRRKGLFESKGCSSPNQEELNVKVFPNPVANEVNVEILGPGHQWAQMEWYDSKGVHLEDNFIEGEYQRVFNFNLTAWKQGIYLLKIYNGKDKKIMKVVVSH